MQPRPQQVKLILSKPGDVGSSLIPATNYFTIFGHPAHRCPPPPSQIHPELGGTVGKAHSLCFVSTPQTTQVLCHQFGHIISTKHKLGMNNTSCVETGKPFHSSEMCGLHLRSKRAELNQQASNFFSRENFAQRKSHPELRHVKQSKQSTLAGASQAA